MLNFSDSDIFVQIFSVNISACVFVHVCACVQVRAKSFHSVSVGFVRIQAIFTRSGLAMVVTQQPLDDLRQF